MLSLIFGYVHSFVIVLKISFKVTVQNQILVIATDCSSYKTHNYDFEV
ncbi:hypothetical protein Clo1100_2155 [Clostridium sp. BNL1100]|nr:hypothetical protein Clo1100_2155 [Clostridium sp. BNL1100]